MNAMITLATSAAKNALYPSSVISKPSLRLAAAISTTALITSENKPKVRQLSGNVKTFRIFPSVAFKKARTATPIIRGIRSSTFEYLTLNPSPSAWLTMDAANTEKASRIHLSRSLPIVANPSRYRPTLYPAIRLP